MSRADGAGCPEVESEWQGQAAGGRWQNAAGRELFEEKGDVFGSEYAADGGSGTADRRTDESVPLELPPA
ncbi:hypothetical protein Q5P01_013785 [Channa striata]|uniref:Uncharacterized protein n=1 Tax=Channa striata TaxID=64152 RepID=A0AA88SNS5_CHASR|nr:hypothetical protein Q5P01_013785 [Channa striata]